MILGRWADGGKGLLPGRPHPTVHSDVALQLLNSVGGQPPPFAGSQKTKRTMDVNSNFFLAVRGGLLSGHWPCPPDNISAYCSADFLCSKGGLPFGGFFLGFGYGLRFGLNDST